MTTDEPKPIERPINFTLWLDADSWDDVRASLEELLTEMAIHGRLTGGSTASTTCSYSMDVKDKTP